MQEMEGEKPILYVEIVGFEANTQKCAGGHFQELLLYLGKLTKLLVKTKEV